MPNAISANKKAVTYLENRSVFEWFEFVAASRQTSVAEILREATSAYYVAHRDVAATPSHFAQCAAKKAAQRRETAHAIATGKISADEAQKRNAPINQPVRILNFWPAIRAHARIRR
jgi:hypothetical protein